MQEGRDVNELLRRARWRPLEGHFGNGIRTCTLLESLRAAVMPESLANLSAELVREISASYGPSEVLLPAVETLVAIAGELRPSGGAAVNVIVDVSAELLEFADVDPGAASVVQNLDALTLEGFSGFLRLLNILDEPVDIDACIRLVGTCAELKPALNRTARQAISPYAFSEVPRIRQLANSWLETLDGQARSD